VLSNFGMPLHTRDPEVQKLMRRTAEILNKSVLDYLPAHGSFRGVTRGSKRGTQGSAEKFQQCRKYFLQYSAFTPKNLVCSNGIRTTATWATTTPSHPTSTRSQFRCLGLDYISVDYSNYLFSISLT